MVKLTHVATLDNIVYCQKHRMILSKGVWLGDNPFDFSTPIFMMQIAISTGITGILRFLLKPLGQCSFVSQMLGGLIAGPTVLGRSHVFRGRIFPPRGAYVFETCQYFGILFFLFLVGLKMDLGIARKSGRKALIIGILSFVLPMLLTISVALLMKSFIPMDRKLGHSLPFIATFESLSSFHVIASFLSDLNLINSEIGRLAMASSMISSICSWTVAAALLIVEQYVHSQARGVALLILSIACMLIMIVYIMRPIMLWMVRNTPEGESIRELHILIIFVMVLVCALFGEFMGQHSLFGPMVLGLAIPSGSPLREMIEDKLEVFVSVVLLPLYFVAIGLRTDLFLIELDSFVLVELIAVFAFLGKVSGTMLPALYYDMTLTDAASLGLIMSAQGIMDLQFFKRALQLRVINEETYSIMIISTVLLTGTISPLIRTLYNPSRRYVAYKRRTIQHLKRNTELRVFVCVYREDNVPTIINLLEASNPTRESTICVYVLHLVELLGQATPILVSHQQAGKDNSSYNNRSKRIINAFGIYEQRNQGIVSIYAFTAISPYLSMHNDICSIALEKRASIIIIPFHKQRTSDGMVETTNPIRNVNRNVFNMAPCSVGLLIDRGTSGAKSCLMGSKSLFRVAVIFLGGADDREALSYGMRMADHSNVSLTVIRFLVLHETIIGKMVDMKLDGVLMNEFRTYCLGNERVVYREEVVTDGVGLVAVIQTMEYKYDLMIVGRRHDVESPLVKGLTEWNEFPELGYIGDMLGSSETDSGVSILVVQQQTRSAEGFNENPDLV
ncbi:hypothetical protein GIB67_020279 [Kingdonia uniflora]|uniref:Cation/H+ exchanger domain-containing protein n=1 Tax=Kingdonia uniflora TaxID=39325 RepID=A0A7J7P3R4_9MAGN|nr:hypothetical protein GIB67_020279 [Kingdonia uniflora]